MMRSVNPKDGSTIAEYPDHDADQVGHALTHAALTFEVWRETTMAERRRLLRVVAFILRDRRERLATLITDEMGKPITQSRAEIDACAECCEYFAEHAAALLAPQPVVTSAAESHVRFDPLGVILGVTSWSAPFWQVFRVAAPALVAGNCVLLKGSSSVTGCALAVEELFALADFPKSVFTTLVVGNDQVERIVRDPRVAAVSVSGSARAGQVVGAAAGRMLKPSVLQLGSSDPFIVLADCDLDAAVSAAVSARTDNAGQSGLAAKRFIVHHALHDTFVDRFARAMSELVLGDPRDERTMVGPLARADLVQGLHFQVEASVRQGARIVLGGAPEERAGNYYPPTLLTEVTRGMPVFDEETLGPVAAITRANDDEDAVRLANASLYGMGASLWTTRERGKALAPRIEAGQVAVNAVPRHDLRLPSGGVKMSGYGRELSSFGLLELVNVKSVWVG